METAVIVCIVMTILFGFLLFGSMFWVLGGKDVLRDFFHTLSESGEGRLFTGLIVAIFAIVFFVGALLLAL